MMMMKKKKKYRAILELANFFSIKLMCSFRNKKFIFSYMKAKKNFLKKRRKKEMPSIHLVCIVNDPHAFDLDAFEKKGGGKFTAFQLEPD